MSKLVVVSNGSRIVDHAIVALVRILRPEWSIELGVGESNPGDQDWMVRVELAGTGRWMAIVSEPDDGARAALALAHGANAVVPLDAELENLDVALDALAHGDSPYLPAEVARLLAEGVLSNRIQPEPTPDIRPRLTRRESEVLGLVAHGLSNHEIADHLSLSVNTVRTHLQSLSVKLHASTRARMVANAWESGLSLAPQPADPKRPAGSVAS